LIRFGSGFFFSAIRFLSQESPRVSKGKGLRGRYRVDGQAARFISQSPIVTHRRALECVALSVRQRHEANLGCSHDRHLFPALVSDVVVVAYAIVFDASTIVVL
jgi:hypothetical protein